VDRLEFVTDMIRRLDDRQWPNKSDLGWSDFDVEVYGSRWCSVRITTAAEPHSEGRSMLRCKLKPSWSLPSHLLFWSLLAIELLFIGAIEPWRPWSWALLLTAAPTIWFLKRQQRALQSRGAAFLDSIARERGYVKLATQPQASPAPPVEAARRKEEAGQPPLLEESRETA
jgi:hypothetical protein